MTQYEQKKMRDYPVGSKRTLTIEGVMQVVEVRAHLITRMNTQVADALLVRTPEGVLVDIPYTYLA